MYERLFRFKSQSFAHFDLSFLFPHFLTLKLMLAQYKSEALQTTYSSTAKPQLREKRTVRRNVCVRHRVPSYLPFFKLYWQDGDQNGACVAALSVRVKCLPCLTYRVKSTG